MKITATYGGVGVSANGCLDIDPGWQTPSAPYARTSSVRRQPAPCRGADHAGGRAETLAWQGLANSIVRGLLRVPFLSRLVGKRLITVYAVGRKSGKRYAVPVAYTPHEGTLLVGTPFGWGRNLRTGVPVEVRFKGSRRVADVVVRTDEEAVVEDYALMSRHNRNFANFNKIGLDAHGNPDSTDLHLAWAAGARAFRLTLR